MVDGKRLQSHQQQDGTSTTNRGRSTASSPTKRKSTCLPNETVDYLKAWMMSPEHIAHPYPTEAEKAKIMADTGIEMKQLTNWFVNNRKRYWKPRVEARLREQQLSPTTTAILKRDGSALSLLDVANSRSSLMVLDTATAANGSGGAASVMPKRTKTRRLPKRESHNNSSDATTATIPLDGSGGDNVVVPMVISEQNSVASTDTEDEEVRGDCVNIHVLQPTNGRATPQLCDVVSVEDGISPPNQQVLATYENCALSDGADSYELERIKRHYLNVYLASVATKTTLQQPVVKPKRKRSLNDVVVESRPKFRRTSLELWKSACVNSRSEDDLPSLEEATQLFGFARVH